MSADTSSYLDNASAQMRKGILEFCVLAAVAKRALYASDIIEALKARDLLVVEGTLYPILSRLKEAGLVEYVWVESREGPPRKYYSLTDKGTAALDGLVERWRQLSSSLRTLISRL